MKNIIKLENQSCTKCPFQKLEVIAFNQIEIIKSCTRCKENLLKIN